MEITPTLDKAMEGEAVWENYSRTDGYWHCISHPLVLDGNTINHGVVTSANFGKFCDYQGVLVGLSLVFKVEGGGGSGWSFESMRDIQQLFNEAKVTHLKDLVGTPMLLVFTNKGGPGSEITACKVNRELVVNRNDTNFADRVSFFIGTGKQSLEKD